MDEYTSTLMSKTIAPEMHAIYVGIVISAIIYGIYAIISGISIPTFRQSTNISYRRKILYVAYTGITFFMNTVAFASFMYRGKMIYIAHDLEYNWPEYYLLHRQQDWHDILGSQCQVVANIFADALMIYRCRDIYRHNAYVILPPITCLVAFAGSSLLGPIFSIRSPTPSQIKTANLYDVVVVSLTVFLNVAVTVMICLRLHIAGREEYSRASMIFIESAAPSAIFGLALWVLFIGGTALSAGVGMIWAMLAALCPQVMLLHLATGNTLTRQSAEESYPNGDENSITLSLEFPINEIQIPRVSLQMFVGDATTTISSWHVANRDATSAIAPLASYENRNPSIASSSPKTESC